MPIVCFDRPNRTNVRHFDARAVGRVAGYAVRDGAVPLSVMALVARELQFERRLCDASAILEPLLPAIQRLTASQRELLRAIRVLSAIARVLPRRFGAAVAAVAALLQLFSKLPPELLAGALFLEELCAEIRRSIDVPRGTLGVGDG